MNNRTWTIVMSLGLIGCFFLPFIKSGNVEVSGYDAVFNSVAGKYAWEKYIWLLIPVPAVFLLIGALNGYYFLGRSLLSWLPLMTVIYILVRFYLNVKTPAGSISFTDFIKLFGVGFWITAALSILLAFVNPRRR